LSLAELSRKTGLHRATVYRFTRTLEVEGFLTYDPDSGLYSVGPAWAAALYSLGTDTVFGEIFRDDMRTLAETVGETVALAVRRGDRVQVINITDSSHAFAPQLPDSVLIPLNASWNVHARVHLAFSSKDTQRRMLAIPAVRYTDNTITDRRALGERLTQVAEQGIAYSHEEYRKGLCAAAVPVLVKGDVMLAVGVVAPVERFSKPDLERFSRELRAAAHSMGARLEKAASAWNLSR
jgi:DNA-binding IclR family transcriptional regulator